ncbi:hypothetical protein DESUT3_29480 [Desulfuromonas versatilis]|uniref:Transposase IS200-like domain-containing protein n=1 Tax=Desulfuromonas versatilis TaxID=2802975 RepID=A0ABM7NFL6_9BACT|nr:transposase [Desulfuromonas versatilis]BCR05879.1 hypothetical protein DESUT3_29480 [Desulfuromonas versatilis]
MPYDPDIHHRRSFRLKGYDYSRSGAYFVTICVQNRECLFGEIADGMMVLNDAGQMVTKWWQELTNKFPTVRPGISVVMPNHFHGIVWIVGADLRVRPAPRIRTGLEIGPNSNHGKNQGAHVGAPLPEIVQWFKTMSTNAYINGVKNHN